MGLYEVVSVHDGPDSLLGQQSQGEAVFLFFSEQQVSDDAKSEDRGVLQSERDNKRGKEGVSTNIQ